MNEKTKTKKIEINSKVWLLISLGAALIVWYLLSIGPATSRSFPFLDKVIPAINTMIDRGVMGKDIASSLTSIAMGFGLGFITALPVAFLMAWYQPVQKILEPWINFIRNIPALAYVPLIVIAAGVGRRPQVILIWICTFMTMSITIYQGIRNIDNTLIKAARVLGANDFDIFVRIIVPATIPFIITAVRLGLGAGLTTLLAAESTGAQQGLGMRIRSLQSTFDTAPMLMYIILIGIIGMILNGIVNFIERRLTGWQEKRGQ
ncbi:MAG: ABC transporter permease [Lachnospiraceae bacterium]|nr:ABC transporter permease [Lachnospiraceae bacterium]